MKEVLTYLFEKNVLTKETAKETLLNMGQGKYSDPEIAAFLAVYIMREITPQELSGFREAFLELAVQADLSEFTTIDVCGTGGDEKNTFNISTLTAFILAGAGEKVTKHGNYSVSSSCGSSNVMEHFGYKFSNDNEKLKKEIDKAGICYMHAPLFHPAMKYVGPVRKSLRLKTFFNILGPLVNPARPQYQIAGVYSDTILDLYHQVFLDAGIKHYVLYSLDGYDEISLTGNFKVISESEEKIYSPKDTGLNHVKPYDIFGGNSVEEATSIFTALLEGKGTREQVDVASINAAFALKCLHPENSLEDCISISKESLLSRNAFQSLKSLISLQ